MRSVTINVQAVPTAAVVIQTDLAAAGFLVTEDGKLVKTEDGKNIKKEG
jgi:hypothetical protein